MIDPNTFDGQTIASLLLLASGAGGIAGLLSGLLGVGGGTIIVPTIYGYLLFLDVPPPLAMQVAVGTSLATLTFTSGASAWGHYQRGCVDRALIISWAPWILLGGILGAILGGIVDGRMLMVVFVGLSVAVSIRLFIPQPSNQRRPRLLSIKTQLLTGVGIGLTSAMAGIGGGLLMVPLFSGLDHDLRRAVGTSSALGCLIGMASTGMYIFSGWGTQGRPEWLWGYVDPIATALIAFFAVLLTQLGVYLAHTIPRRSLQLIFATWLLLMAVKMASDLRF